MITVVAGAGTTGRADATEYSESSAPLTPDAMAVAAVTSAAGRSPTEFAVSHSGAATYQIPLWTPPGVGEVELDLALVYNSRSTSGPLGVGWSLSGLSNIARCNRNLAQDGMTGGVTNTVADRYCLDGQPLKLVSGTHGVAGAVYATAIESFSRIVANGAAGNGPASFTVTTRNGLIYEYGSTADARVYAGNTATVRAWALSRVRDRAGTGSGNSIALNYINEAQSGAYTNGTHRIASISYPTTATGAGPFYRVDFTYSPRPASDIPSGYLAGNLVRDPYQLDRITVQAVGGAAPIKSYSLVYATATTTGRLRLNSVQECGATTCLQPTTISYQDGVRGWQAMSDTGVVTSKDRNPVPLDLNGDGLQDILYPVNAGTGRLSWRVLFGTPTGLAAPFDTGLFTTTSHTIIPGAFAGNGRMQFLLQQSGYWYVAGYTNAGFTVANTGLIPGGEYAAADFDGDGLADLMSLVAGTTSTIRARRNTATPSAASLAVTFAATSQAVWTTPGPRRVVQSEGLRVADLNGDGRADILALSHFESLRDPKFFATPLLSNGFGNPFTVGVENELWQGSMVTLGDWNADGCSDIVQVTAVYLANCAGNFAWMRTNATPATGDSIYTAVATDWNEDGRTDLLYIDAATKKWFVVASTGPGVAAPVNTGIAAPVSTTWFDLDLNGDGLSDLAYRDGSQGNRLRYHLHAGTAVPPDLATVFVDGFGVRHSPTYVSIARSNHVRRNDAVFPAADFQGPLYVVNEFSANDGGGGVYRNQFTYEGARVHLQGLGFQGFATQRIVDSRLNLVTVDTVERDYPYTGMHRQRSVFQANGTTPVSQWQAQLALQAMGSAGSEQRLFPYVASTSDKQYEAGGALNGTLVTEATNVFTYGDGYGNPTQVQASSWDRDPYSPFFNGGWRTTTNLSYANDPGANWCLGLPAASTVTSTAYGQAAQTRTAAYATDPAACRITQETLEPNSPALKVVTSYGFDSCGNVASIAITAAQADGAAMPARTTRFNYGSRCQLPESIINAAGEPTGYGWRYDFGVLARVEDANGIATSWAHDEFGRRVSEAAPDGTRSTWSFTSCGTSGCWGTDERRFQVTSRRHGTDGTLIGEQMSYFDGYERLRLLSYQGPLGSWLNRTYDFDAAGRPVRESRPFSIVPNGQTSRVYDLLGRVVSQRELDAAGATVGSVVLAYAGRSLTLTDALGRSHTRTTDVSGRVRRVVDPAPGGTTRYDYDSFGNLARVQDAGGAVSTGLYNVRGFRTKWSDADSGAANYAYNSLGEQVRWTDAKGQVLTAGYDALGRLITRSEPEGVSTWTWGSSAASRNVGRLQSKQGLGYAEARTYDGVGRISARRITSDQAYDYDYTYNTIGEIDTLTYPLSPVPADQAGTRFKVRYSYNLGAPVQVDDVTSSAPRTLWRLSAVNDFSAPTGETMAGGQVSRSATYDMATQRLTGLQAGAAGAVNNRQNLAYQWDAAGNLLQRRDLNQNVTEAFAYDGLDRLTGSSLNGASSLSVGYDAAGNIRQKSDVGAYSYGNSARPNAVTAAGAETFSYDGNGNLASRNGQSQDWTSFNLPRTLRKSGYESRFEYGPDHERWRQVATYQNGTETTHYVGTLLEKESATSTGVTYWRHYVPTPGGSTVIVSRNSNGTSSTTYVLADHLGSSDTLLSDSGSSIARESYAAFGSRRGSDWTSGTAPDWAGIANSTRQGFTGHEMLDNVGIVHMNGRVYDPALGRFLSVDPLIGNLADSQSVNPYAYVGNRPLNTTDPTGLIADGGATILITKFLVNSVFASVLGGILSHGGGLPPPPATALPGRSAQGGVGLCGPGTFSPVCGGQVLYRGTPGIMGMAPTSTFSETTLGEEYARENLEQFFADLGINAVEVLILSPVRDAQAGVDAAKRGDVATAVYYFGFVLCDVAKPCQSVLAPTKAIRRVAKAAAAGGRHDFAARGTAVLGKFPDYLKRSDELGAKRFNIPTSVWNRMSATEQWAANQKFLDRAIARGDDIVLSNPVRNINDVTGSFRRELDYLIGNGFRLSADGTRLIR